MKVGNVYKKKGFKSETLIKILSWADDTPEAFKHSDMLLTEQIQITYNTDGDDIKQSQIKMTHTMISGKRFQFMLNNGFYKEMPSDKYDVIKHASMAHLNALSTIYKQIVDL